MKIKQEPVKGSQSAAAAQIAAKAAAETAEAAGLPGDLSFEELCKPVKAVEEKYKLLPYFLKLRGLMRQHIDSFNHFINVDMKEIVAARSNQEIRSEADPKFFLRYTDIYLGKTPMPCARPCPCCVFCVVNTFASVPPKPICNHHFVGFGGTIVQGASFASPLSASLPPLVPGLLMLIPSI